MEVEEGDAGVWLVIILVPVLSGEGEDEVELPLLRLL